MKKLLIPALLLALVLAGCTEPTAENYVPETPRLTSPIMSPEVLWSFGRIGETSLSPDGQSIMYGVSWINIEENRSYRDIYILPVSGGEAVRLTDTPENEYNLTWRPDGKKIGFLKGGKLYEMNPDGTALKLLAGCPEGITGFSYAPDGKHIAVTQEVKMKQTVQDLHPDLPKADARIVDDLMYRHWDSWVDTYSHIFVGEYDKGKVGELVDIMQDEPWESPVRPWGGFEQIAWSADGEKLVYVCRKKEGKDYALSTNTDLYEYDLNSGKTINLTAGMMGYDMNPVFSPDGNWLAWESMERDGYEADKNRLFLLNLKTGEKKYVTESFDQNVQGLAWSEDSQVLWFISDFQATGEIYQYNLNAQVITKLTEGIHDYAQVIPAAEEIIAVRHSMSKPDEIYRVSYDTGEAVELSFVNKGLLDQLELGRVEYRWITTTDGKQMKVWVIYPPGFDPNKKYPALLYCQGGPQSTVSQFWSYRWNFQMMAAMGYVVVAPNRRGLPGFGQEWNEQISGDYGGQNMLDYLVAIDLVAAEPFVDETRLGAVGASYGGFSVYWLAGNHNKRFKAFIAHDGMFNFESQYLETEEFWFPNWDMGGPFWQADNAVAQKTYATSPHKFVQNWDTPILVIHGEKDYRVTVSQGFQAFNAARLMGIEAQLLYFPEENHWVLSPQNGILWQRTFAGWLDKYLK